MKILQSKFNVFILDKEIIEMPKMMFFQINNHYLITSQRL